MDSTEQLLDGDTVVLDELKREAQRRGYVALVVNRELLSSMVLILCGMVYGALLFGGSRG